MVIRHVSNIALVALLLAGCGPGGTPEDEIRALVETAELAAEERDATELRALIAEDYSDGSGRSAADVRGILHGYLIAHQSVRLLTRIDSIELEGTELARVKVTVGMLGRDAASESNWDLAGDVYRFDLRLAREGGDWRVIRAGWQSEL